MKSFEIDSIDQLSAAASWLIQNFGGKKIVAFTGEMGVGKTTLIKEICKQLGSSANATSPTFAIVNEYITAQGNSLFHFDFYRINKAQELTDLGLDEYLASGNYCFIEWPEIGDSLLPSDTLKLNLKLGEKQKRILTIFV
jgi:tRNA threonylcarbamoyladenosine biosynthesis protein TsaE